MWVALFFVLIFYRSGKFFVSAISVLHNFTVDGNFFFFFACAWLLISPRLNCNFLEKKASKDPKVFVQNKERDVWSSDG